MRVFIDGWILIILSLPGEGNGNPIHVSVEMKVFAVLVYLCGQEELLLQSYEKLVGKSE